MRQFAENRIFISDSPSGDLESFAKNENTTYMGSAADAESFEQALTGEVDRLRKKRSASGLSPREFIASEPPTLVLIDDGEAFISYTTTVQALVEPQLRNASDFGICFIGTSLGSKLRGFDTVSNMFKSPQAGLILGNPGEAMTHYPGATSIPRHKPTPEIGFWYKRGDIKKIKLPFVE